MVATSTLLSICYAGFSTSRKLVSSIISYHIVTELINNDSFDKCFTYGTLNFLFTLCGTGRSLSFYSFALSVINDCDFFFIGIITTGTLSSFYTLFGTGSFLAVFSISNYIVTESSNFLGIDNCLTSSTLNYFFTLFGTGRSLSLLCSTGSVFSTFLNVFYSIANSNFIFSSCVVSAVHPDNFNSIFSGIFRNFETNGNKSTFCSRNTSTCRAAYSVLNNLEAFFAVNFSTVINGCAERANLATILSSKIAFIITFIIIFFIIMRYKTV